ncbi:MAG: recombinase family protein [Micromonosporaceae bacterium]
MTSAQPIAKRPEGKRAVLYLRVSSRGQVDTDYDPEGISLPAQRVACQRKAADLRATVVDEYIEPGRTATNDKRPRFQEMMARIKTERDIDYIIVYARNRMHRNTIDSAITKRDLRTAGAQLVSVIDYTDETEMGDLVAHILDGVYEFQSRASGADIRYKMARKVAVGGTVSRAKLGYLNVREHVDGREIRTIAVDPDRAPYIVMLFELYATGKHSFKTLREAVTQAGLRTRPTKQRPAGSPVSIHKIGDLLQDRYYLGYVSHNGQEHQGRHEPLVTHELFDKVQKILHTERRAGTRARKHNHYLKGAIWCHRCKSRLIYTKGRSKTGRDYFYFVCRGRQDHICDLPLLSAAEVEAEVARQYITLQLPHSDIDRVKAAMTTAVADHQETTHTMRRQLRRERKRLDTLEDQYLELVGDPDWPRDKLTAKVRKVKHDRDLIDAQLADTTAGHLDHGSQAVTAVLELLHEPQRLYANASDDARRILNKACFTKLWLDTTDDKPKIADSLRADLMPTARGDKDQPESPKQKPGDKLAKLLNPDPKGQGLSSNRVVDRTLRHANRPPGARRSRPG